MLLSYVLPLAPRELFNSIHRIVKPVTPVVSLARPRILTVFLAIQEDQPPGTGRLSSPAQVTVQTAATLRVLILSSALSVMALV